MRILLNWRYYAMVALCVSGIICIALAFGEDNKPIEEWLTIHLGLFGFGMGQLFLLDRLTKRWKSENSIPEFTNTKNN